MLIDMARPTRPLTSDEEARRRHLIQALAFTSVSQSELARRLDVDFTSVSRWWHGRQALSASRWFAIASVLGLAADWEPPEEPTMPSEKKAG